MLLSCLIPLIATVLIVLISCFLKMLLGWCVDISLVNISLIILGSMLILTSIILLVGNKLLLNKKYKIIKSQRK